jgi:hypothetical protein
MPPSLFCFSSLSDKVSRFFPSLISNCDPPSQAAGITGVIYHSQFSKNSFEKGLNIAGS